MFGARVVELATRDGAGERLHVAWVEVPFFPHLITPRIVIWQE